LRFVCEGSWRQSQIIKGRWRDTAWYAQLGADWLGNKLHFERWLAC
jgi:RimJ/RimL family protein N-acetyltransferase